MHKSNEALRKCNPFRIHDGNVIIIRHKTRRRIYNEMFVLFKSIQKSTEKFLIFSFLRDSEEKEARSSTKDNFRVEYVFFFKNRIKFSMPFEKKRIFFGSRVDSYSIERPIINTLVCPQVDSSRSSSSFCSQQQQLF